MVRFTFRVDECMPGIDGFEGVVLAGPPVERGFDFHVGQRIVVPTTSSDVLARCTAFVLARWGPGREDWMTITVMGVDSASVVTGQIACAESHDRES